jgi:MFS family permease
MWLAQVLSVGGDQLARVALTVLVYDRTRSALLAAVTFAASIVPMFVGGLALSGLADRLPRRQVMTTAALASGVLVVIMAVPGMPLPALVVLLFAVTMLDAPFLAARSATLPEVLPGELYPLGVAVGMTTTQFAQVAGFAAGGVVVGFLGVRVSLLADAATFGASALLVWFRVRARPAARAPGAGSGQPGEPDAAATVPDQGRGLVADAVAGVRLVFGNPAMCLPMLFGWLSAFYDAPAGVVAPLARLVGGGAVTVGLIFAAQAMGTTAGLVGFTRLAGPGRRLRLMGPLAVASCGALILFALGPGLAGVLLILTVSGGAGCYQVAANAAFVGATPPSRRSQAFGVAQGGMSLGQGLMMILAGAAAERFSASVVIAAIGCLGTVCALALAAAAARSYRKPGRHRRSPQIPVAKSEGATVA